MKKQIVYKGWIPVISGNLSFNEIGNTRQVKRFKKVNITDNTSKVQTIAMFGDRKLNDGWFPNWILRLFQQTTTFRTGMVCFSKGNSLQKRSELDGLAFFVRTGSVEQNIFDFINSNYGSPTAMVDFFARTKNSVGIIKSAKINIKRTGECTITFDAEEEITEFVAQQFYFFIKDACHHHYHHNPSSDSITKAYRISEDHENEWKMETLFSLHRSIVAYRRYRNDKMLRDAIGISSYASTFEKIFLKDHIIGTGAQGSKSDEGETKINEYCADQSVNSLSVLLEELNDKRSEFASIVTLVTSVTLAVLAIIVTLKQIEEFKNIPFGNGIALLGEYAIKNPILTSILAGASMVAAQTVFVSPSPLVRWFIEKLYVVYARLQFLNKWILLIVFFVLTCTVYYYAFEIAFSLTKK